MAQVNARPRKKNILRRCAVACIALLILSSLMLLIFGDFQTTQGAINAIKDNQTVPNEFYLPEDLGGALVVPMVDANSGNLWMVTTEENGIGEYSYIYVLDLDREITTAYRYIGDKEQLESMEYKTPVDYDFSLFSFHGSFDIEVKENTSDWNDEGMDTNVRALCALSEQVLGQYVPHTGAVVMLVLLALELFALISFIGASKLKNML